MIQSIVLKYGVYIHVCIPVLNKLFLSFDKKMLISMVRLENGDEFGDNKFLSLLSKGELVFILINHHLEREIKLINYLVERPGMGLVKNLLTYQDCFCYIIISHINKTLGITLENKALVNPPSIIIREYFYKLNKNFKYISVGDVGDG